MVALGAPPVNPSWYSNTAATFTLELEFYLFEQGKKAVVAAEAKAVRPAALVSLPLLCISSKNLIFPPPIVSVPINNTAAVFIPPTVIIVPSERKRAES